MKMVIIESTTNYSIRCYPSKFPYVWYSKTRWAGRSSGGTAWTTHCDDINLNIPRIEKEAIANNISFNDMLSHCISHEIMHNILEDMDANINDKFDNICYHKNTNFALWIGGIG